MIPLLLLAFSSLLHIWFTHRLEREMVGHKLRAWLCFLCWSLICAKAALLLVALNREVLHGVLRDLPVLLYPMIAVVFWQFGYAYLKLKGFFMIRRTPEFRLSAELYEQYPFSRN